MRIKHIHTNLESEIQFYTWLSKPGKFNYEIIDRGDVVYLIEYHNDDRIEYLFDLERNHALRMIKSQPTKYGIEELHDLPNSEKIKLALRELDWQKSKKLDLNELVQNLKFAFTIGEMFQFAENLDENGLVKAVLHKDGGQLTLTLKGKEYLNSSTRLIINPFKDDRAMTKTDKKVENKKEVFVTYAWESEQHKSIVLSFVDYLRRKGFNTDIDRKITQEETATDFTKMMHQAITDYKKVIIVLSEGYKKKANEFKGGVGTEYRLIINQIDEDPNKYILVCFGEVNADIIPANFKGREIIDISKKDNHNGLFAKLQEEKLIKFSDVSKEKPKILETPIVDFEKLIH